VTSQRLQILCISLSPITGDSRVLRQISVLREFGDVTTVGFGPPPEGVAHHIEVPAGLATLPQTLGGIALLATRQWRRAELKAPAIAFALKALEGKKFHLVIANEARVLGMADTVAHGAPVWADMHEWAPEERTHILSWRILVAPLMVHLCRKYLPRAAAVTAVCGSIANLYLSEFGVPTQVMRNSGPWRNLSVRSVNPNNIRLVHSGAAVAGRDLETMIDVVMDLDDRYTLDVYLVPGGDGGAYLQSLKNRASGCSRITFKDPVAPEELPATLNAYDVGVFWIPPTHTNARLTLPNKFFDYVQARLAIAIGPSIEMQTLVNQFHLGTISTGFTRDECYESIVRFSADDIARAKAAADASARTLSFDTDAEVARGILRQTLST
jgi:hypothetical protein